MGYPERKWKITRVLPPILIMNTWRCWVCDSDLSFGEKWVTVPAGWRVTVRGNAGQVGICDKCNREGKNYRSDC